MKKIKVITRHLPSNYGSLLQCIATIKSIGFLGYDCEIIDYERKDERGFYSVLKSGKVKGFHGLKFIVYVLLRSIEDLNAQRKFKKMRNSALKLTALCENKEDLEKLKADIFMTGSDQVWGPVISGTCDSVYFLDFVSAGKRVAFSASFGTVSFDLERVDAYKSLLSKYDAIATREDSAVTLLNEWNIPCLGQVLDPTLLLNSDEWREYESKKIPKGKYVLIYQLHRNPKFSRYAEAFAKKAGLPLYRVSPTLHQKGWGGKFIYLPDYQKFLACIDGAEYLLTDSFHGTAFALIFNTRFIDILPLNGTGCRIESILRVTGLMNRILQDYDDFSYINKDIEWALVNSIVARERKESLNVLKKILQ